MLLIKTYLDLSAIHGIGLFADQDIPAETVLWRFMAPFDLTFTESDLRALPPPGIEVMQRYAYFDKHLQRYVLCGDDARFMNHSDEANTYETKDLSIAKRLILRGEEITSDYSQFDVEFWKKIKGEAGA